MPCTIDNLTLESVLNLVKNRKNVYSGLPLNTAEDIKAAILAVADNFERIEIDTVYGKKRVYAVKGNNSIFFSNSYSQVGKKQFKIDPEKGEPKIAPETQISMDFGNFVHDIAYKYVQDIHENGVDSQDKYIAEMGSSAFKIPPAQAKLVLAAIKQDYLEAKAYQDKINQETGKDDKLVIIAEVPIFDNKRDLAGTPDLVYIFSNKDAYLRDYKTFKGSLDQKLSQSSAQLQEIKNTLNTKLGVTVISNKIIPFSVKYKYDKLGNMQKEVKSFLPMVLDKTKNPNSIFSAGYYDLTGNKDVDVWLINQYKALKSLKDRRKKVKSVAEKNTIYNRTLALEAAISEFMNYRKVETLVKYMKEEVFPEVFIVNNDSTIDKDIRLQRVNDLLQELSNYQNVLNALDFIIKDKGDAVRDPLIEVQSEAINMINILVSIRNDIYFDNKTERIMQADGSIEVDKVNFIEKQFSKLTDFDHPVIKAFARKHSELADEANAKLVAFRSKMTRLGNNVNKELKTMGTSFKDVFIGEDGNLINDISEEGKKQIKKAKATKGNNENLEANNNIYNIRPEFDTWYKQAYDNEKERLEKGRSKDPAFKEMEDKEIAKKLREFELNFNIRKYAKAFNNPQTFWAKELKQEFKLKYMSDKFKVIYNNPVLREFWDFTIESNIKSREMLKMNASKLPYNFYANIQRTVFDSFKEGDFKEGYATFSKTIALTPKSNKEVGIIGNNIEERNQIPIFFLDKIDASEKSYDFERTMTLFYEMAVNYDRAVKLEAHSIAAKALMHNTKIVNKDNKGNVYTDFMRNVSKKVLGDDEIIKYQEILEHFTQMYVYGNKVEEIGDFTFNGKTYSGTRVISEAMKFARASELGFNFVGGIGSGLAARMSLNTFVKKGIQVTDEQMKQYRIDFFKDRKAFGILNSIIDPDIQGINNKTTNRKDLDNILLKPYSYPDELNVAHLSYGMFQNYGLDSEGNIRLLSNLEPGTKSLKDSLNITTLPNGEITYNFEGMSVEDTLKKMESFKRIVRKTWNKIAGTVSDADKGTYSRNIIGQVLMMYKSWLPGVVEERFAKAKYDEVTDTLVYGRFRVAGNKLIADIKANEGFANKLKAIALNAAKMSIDVGTMGVLNYIAPKYKEGRVNLTLSRELYNDYISRYPNSSITFDQWVQTERGQMAAMINELRAVALFGLAMMLLGYDDDDEIYSKSNNAFAGFAYHALKKAQTEMLYFYNPTDLIGTASVPILRTVGNVAKMLGNTADSMRDVATGNNYKGIFFWEEDLYDSAPPLFYTSKFIKGVSGIKKMTAIVEDAMEEE